MRAFRRKVRNRGSDILTRERERQAKGKVRNQTVFVRVMNPMAQEDDHVGWKREGCGDVCLTNETEKQSGSEAGEKEWEGYHNENCHFGSSSCSQMEGWE